MLLSVFLCRRAEAKTKAKDELTWPRGQERGLEENISGVYCVCVPKVAFSLLPHIPQLSILRGWKAFWFKQYGARVLKLPMDLPAGDAMSRRQRPPRVNQLCSASMSEIIGGVFSEELERELPWPETGLSFTPSDYTTIDVEEIRLLDEWRNPRRLFWLLPTWQLTTCN